MALLTAQLYIGAIDSAVAPVDDSSGAIDSAVVPVVAILTANWCQ